MKRKPTKRRKPAESETVKLLRELAATIRELRESIKNHKPPQITVMPAPPAPIIIKLPPLDDGQTGTPAPWKPSPPPWNPQWDVTCTSGCMTAHTQTAGRTNTAIVWVR
jgi:hypothetical protein